MRDFLDLGTTVPLNEDCAQIGDSNYRMDSNTEAKAFIDQIKRINGEPPIGASVSIVSCPHDFGTYYDVRLIYDTSIEESEEWVFKVENNLPYEWDEEALEFLKNKLYNFPTKGDQL